MLCINRYDGDTVELTDRETGEHIGTIIVRSKSGHVARLVFDFDERVRIQRGELVEDPAAVTETRP